jgi:hypothetical protein
MIAPGTARGNSGLWEVAGIAAGDRYRYWKIRKCPRSHQSRRKIRIVVKHPPPSFFAPHPAAMPRSSLLIG